jgi:hypothetical protein
MAIGACGSCGRLYMYGREKVVETRCPRCRKSLRGIGCDEAVSQHRGRRRTNGVSEDSYRVWRALQRG